MAVDPENPPMAVVSEVVAKNGEAVEAASAGGAKASEAPPAYQAHPLGPLSADEIKKASALVRQAWPEGTLFQFKAVTLLEPAKLELIPYLDAERKGQVPTDIDRRAFVVYYLKNTVRYAERDTAWAKAC